MVDFNSEVIQTRSRNDVTKLALIEHNYYVQDAIEKYHKQIFSGTKSVVEADLKARIIRLYVMLQQSLKEFWGDKNNNKKGETDSEERLGKIKVILESKTAKTAEYLELYDYLCEFLYENDVTKFIDRRSHDSSDPFEEDQQKGT